MNELSGIENLIGEQISGVEFVRDYVEFHFDGPILRSIANPIIRLSNVEYQFPEPGSRDALCQAIGSTVRSLNVEENHAMNMTTSNGCTITIPLKPQALRGGEAMHFVPTVGKGIQVW